MKQALSKRPALFTALCLLAAGVSLARADAAPRVAVSIKPVHSLVAGVMEGVGAPTLLVKGAASPHTYSLRPSDVRAIRSAELVFWVGDEVEPFLAKPLAALARGARVVELSRIEGVTLLDARTGGVRDSHGDHGKGSEKEHARHGEHARNEHRHPEHGHDEHGHDEQGQAAPARHEEPGTHREEGHAHERHETDVHLWLSPDNAQAITRAVVRALSETDPPNAALYRENGRELAARLDALDEEVRETLRAVLREPYFVFHDAYQYFESHYGLNAMGSITVSPDRQPGARRLHEIRQKIRASGAYCVFSEPQFEPKLVEILVHGTHARTGVLDPLGADLEPGVEAYFTLLRDLASAFRSCLGTAPP